MAKRFGAQQVIIAGKPPYVYTKDFIKYKNAKPIKKIRWKSYRKIINSHWTPGMSAPMDPIGAKLAQKLKLKAAIVKGTDLKNLEKLLKDKKFKGTTIE